MQKKEFIDAVVEGLKVALPDKEIIYNEIRKNNNIKLHGVSIMEKEKEICPTLYLDRFFSRLGSNNIVEEAVREIVDLYNRENMNSIDLDLSMFSDYSKIQSRVFICLVNTERNQDMLSTVPNRDFMDLSIVYKILVHNDMKNGIATVLIHNDLMNKLGVTEQELYEQAMINTTLLFRPVAMDIMDVIDVFGRENEEISEEINNYLNEGRGKMVVCTNNSNCYGANVFLNKEFLLDTMRKYSFPSAYILPSSTGEIIILKDEPERIEDIHELVEMVHEVNCTNVAAEEYLADSVYKITLEDEEIRLVDSY